MSPYEDHLRVGDAERAQAADRLAAHAAAGRLTLEELERRVERTQVAVYARDLLAVEADLPGPAPRPVRRAPRAPVPALALLLAAAVAASVAVGHPIAPLFVLVVLLARFARRAPVPRTCASV